jgi:ribosomal protein L35AE/L33A
MRDYREGLIINYRIGGKTQYPKQCLIKVLSAEVSDAKRALPFEMVEISLSDIQELHSITSVG